ncbi:MAG: YkgJ family cysteine cluster protein, partial [Betaproteobacteria bacterium]|nr:YkgJ family cysteine cluster protein [Betaproteobacteria bacterium]
MTTRPVRIPVKSAPAKKKGPKPQYDCTKCPGYCCTYTLIEIGKRDIARLAKHFGLSYQQAETRFTKYDKNEKARALRHQKDRIFKSICMFFDKKKRQCTVYDVRPGVCRDYPPDTPRCGY